MGENDIYNDYFLWNDALWEYYFGGNNRSEQVLLYVSDDIIRNIGCSNDAIRDRLENELELDDYLEFFYDSILLRSSDDVRNFFYCGLTRNGDPRRAISEVFLGQARIDNALSAYRRQETQTTAIFEFARALASIQDQRFPHKCPCLSYVVFLILAYSENRTYDGLISILREKSGLPNANILPEQFMELFRSVEEWSKDNDGIPRFYADRIRGNQEFVGVLRYHLVLNRAEATQLQDALYKYNVEWDESETTYKDLIYNRVLPIITHPEIKNALRKTENYSFFYNLFHSFSPENYTPSTEIPKKQRGHFFLLYDRENKNFLLKTDVRAYDNDPNRDLVVGNDVVKISCDGERECGLYSAIYEKGDVGIDSYLNIYYADDNLNVIPIRRDWLFFIMSGKYFQQVLTPVENEGCLIITRKSFGDVRQGLHQDDLRDYTQDLNTIFGESYNVFYVERWKNDVVLTDNSENGERDEEELPAGPKLINGILNPAFKRCYLPEGLPIIQCEKRISVDDVAIYEDTVLSRTAACIDKSSIDDNNIRLTLNTATNQYQEFYVVVSDELVGAIRIKGSNRVNRENSIWYDSWGCASACKDEDSVLCDNSIVVEEYNISKVDNEESFPLRSNKFLIPLLKSYAYARKDPKEFGRSYLLDRDISKIINYVSLVEQWDIDKDELGYVKYNLINMGVLSMATNENGERRFEVNNPRFVPIGNNKYLLYGAYTFLQVEEIRNSPEISTFETIDVPDVFSDLYVVEFKDSVPQPVLGIPVASRPMEDVLLEITQRMNLDAFREKFFNAPVNALSSIDGCKFGTPSKDHFFNYIHEGDKEYSRYLRSDNTFQQIPTPLLKLYNCRVNKKPLMMWDEETSTFSFDWNMGIPYYVERALCLISKSVGVREKVFGMDSCMENKLFSTITSFHLSNPDYKDKILSILSDGQTDLNESVFTYQEYKGDISLYYKLKEEENKSGIYHEFVLLRGDKVELVVQKRYVATNAFGFNEGQIKSVDTKSRGVNAIISNYISGNPLEWGAALINERVLTIDAIKENYQQLRIIKKK